MRTPEFNHEETSHKLKYRDILHTSGPGTPPSISISFSSVKFTKGEEMPRKCPSLEETKRHGDEMQCVVLDWILGQKKDHCVGRLVISEQTLLMSQ